MRAQIKTKNGSAVGRLEDEEDQSHFQQHLQRYINLSKRDCPFEITTTTRYTGTTNEASITARRDIKAHEEIKDLVGIQVVIDDEQERALAFAGSDFSLIISNRRKTCSLLLGPARFANHDCDANAQLAVTVCDGIQIIAVKPIRKGDEVTVSYGKDYFGLGNKECLCNTCELTTWNGRAMEGIHDNSFQQASSNTRITRSMSRAGRSVH
jgi:histone-lysine N-methyltransferase SUV420H